MANTGSLNYTLKGYAEQTECPILVCYADHDELAIYARQLFDALTCPKQFTTFTSAEGAGEHCEFGNRWLFHQRTFDRFDKNASSQESGNDGRFLV